MKIGYLLWSVVVLLLVFGCETKNQDENKPKELNTKDTHSKREYEAISLLGDTLYAIELPEDQKMQYDSALQLAKLNYQHNPDNLQNIIWLGRQYAFSHQYQEAIKIYTTGIQKFPYSPELYRHRGHRYITTRQFDKAVIDLEKSASLAESIPIIIEPDGIPLSTDHTPTTLQFNIYYHLGLAYYLTGAYGKAAQAYEKCLTYCEQQEEIIATADWLYMTYRRLGEDEIAEKTLDMVKEDMHLQDSEGYFESILMYKGLIEPDSLLQIKQPTHLTDHTITMANQAYGVGSYYLVNGESEKGSKILHDVMDGRYWVALGYIAAEADLARLKKEEINP